MPYIPERYLHSTEFPTAFEKDVHFQIRLIEEKWRRMYPLVTYYAFKGDVTPATVPVGDPLEVVGEPGGSAFDPLYGESVDPAQLADGVWRQPHNSPGVAAEPEIFNAPVKVRARVFTSLPKKDLKKYGFDEFRDLVVVIPASVLDSVAITVRPGDEFTWDGDRYIVMQENRAGYWKNTNLGFYRTINAQHKHRGA